MRLPPSESMAGTRIRLRREPQQKLPPTNEVRDEPTRDPIPTSSPSNCTNEEIYASSAREMVSGKEEGCFDTGTSAICLPCREMLDNPVEIADSNLRVRLANKSIEKVEGEGPFGGEPALVTSTFGSMLIPAGAVTKHSIVMFIDDRMIVVPKYRCRYHVSKIEDSEDDA